MSAIPKKKLCWNCEGNVSRDIDNCPYCGVYLHAEELEEENASWNPSYRPASKTEEIPSPLYYLQEVKGEIDEEESPEKQVVEVPLETSLTWNGILAQLKQDVFPLLFLMMGSIFFLFGIILLLFAHEGVLTLQWKSHYAFYFLGFALPLILLGWKYLQQIDDDHSP